MSSLVNKFTYKIRKQEADAKIASSRLRAMYIAKNQLLDGGLEGVGVDHNYPDNDNPMVYANLVVLKHDKCLLRKGTISNHKEEKKPLTWDEIAVASDCL